MDRVTGHSCAAQRTSENPLHAKSGGPYRALGWTNGGLLEVGALCDLTSMKNDSVRTAGVPLAEKASVASAVDVETVVVGGRVVVASGQHVLGEIPALLREAIDPLCG